MAEVYKLSDACRPSLEPGSYELEVSWEVKIDGEPEQLGGRPRQESERMEGTETFKFDVAGERFWLNPNEIDSVYPPEGSTGDYSNDLPHIALSRDTLPWERTAKADSDPDKRKPWLALLLFNQDEADKCPLKTITLQEYKTRLAAYSPVKDLAGHEDKSVTVFELPQDLARAVLPKLRELPVLCHARVTKDDAGNAVKVVNSVAVVVSKRVPSPGRNTAHLVMLEDRFTGDDVTIPTNATGCLLISLKSWTFTSQPAAEGANATISELKPGWLTLETASKSTATNYEKAGFVPLPHRFRSGESGVSWYAGPLNCGVPIFQTEDAKKLVKLPAKSADDLLWFDEDLGMLNVTYAAAWELGRLLAMQNRSMLSLLHKWRSQQVHRHQASSEAATGADCCHLPQVQGAAAKTAPEAPAELTNWLDSLRRLEGIPYRYLLPDERLLPADSIRVVSLDRNYINALLDGVLSSVRAASPCPEQCEKSEQKLLGEHSEVVSGFFLRSVRVAGLPRLEVLATHGNPPSPIEAYASARLSPSILLYLFKGKADRIKLRQKPDTLHLSAKGKVIDLSNTTGLAFAKEMMADRLEELTFDVTW